MITILDYEGREEWRSLLAEMNADDVYFSPEYLKVNETIIGGKLECCVYQDAEEVVLYPYLRRRIDGSELFDITSAYGYGGHVTSTPGASLARFHAAFCRYCRETDVVSEFIRFHPLYENHAQAERGLLRIRYRQPVVTLHYDGSASAFEREIRKEAWKKVRKAQNHGVQVVEDVGAEHYPDFIELYKETMDFKRARDFYYFNPAFFAAFRRLMAARSLLFVAWYEGGVVGGLLVLHGGGFAYNFLSCSRPEYRRLGTNDLLQLRALQWAQAAGMKAYLLGGGLDGEDSLFHFKAKFSSQRKGFFVGERIHLSQVYDDLSRQAIERRNGDPDESAATSWFPLYRSVPQEQEALTHEA
jgi:hypothetical protein